MMNLRCGKQNGENVNLGKIFAYIVMSVKKRLLFHGKIEDAERTKLLKRNTVLD
jgi:hypothetical protein